MPALLVLASYAGWRLLDHPREVAGGEGAQFFLLLDGARERIARASGKEEGRVHRIVPRLLVLADALDALSAASRAAWREHLESVSGARMSSGGDGSLRVEAFTERSPGAALLSRLSGPDEGSVGVGRDGDAGLALLLAEPSSPRARALVRQIDDRGSRDHPVDSGARMLYAARIGDPDAARFLAQWVGPAIARGGSRRDSLGAALQGLALAMTETGFVDGMSILTRTGEQLARHVPLNEFQSPERAEVWADRFFADFGLLSDTARLVRRTVVEGVEGRTQPFVAGDGGLALASWFVECDPDLAGWDGYLPDSLRPAERLVALARRDADPAWAWLAARRLVRDGKMRGEDVPESLSAWRSAATGSSAWGRELKEWIAYPDRLVSDLLAEDRAAEDPADLLQSACEWWREVLPAEGMVRSRVGEDAVAFVMITTLERTLPRVGEAAPWNTVRRELREDLLSGREWGAGSVFHVREVAAEVAEAWMLDPGRRLWFDRLRDEDLRDPELLWPLAENPSAPSPGGVAVVRLAESVPGLGCAVDVLSMTASTEPSGGSRLQ